MSSATPPCTPAENEYGVLHSRNIKQVEFGQFTIDTWYGNGAYFASARNGQLGTETTSVPRKKDGLPSVSGFWLDTLYVCDFCFKYTSDKSKLSLHMSSCPLNQEFPPIGTLVYADVKGKRLIKKVRGFRHELFCQNLSLFGKLFLDDKSVYYNVESYDFYIVYGASKMHAAENKLDDRTVYRPMGFFSKEITAWEPDNNLACICIFPPYQRLHLGSLLIEFLYAAAEAAGQQPLGPEFPLSPYGKQLYLRYWGKRIAFELFNSFENCDLITLGDLAVLTGFRREDLFFALEHMGVLYTADTSGSPPAEAVGEQNPTDEPEKVASRSKGKFFYLPFSRLQRLDNRALRSKSSTTPEFTYRILLRALMDWCEKNKVSTEILSTMLDPSCLLV